MTYVHYMMEQFTLAHYLDFFARVVLACACGAAIGFERSMRYKEAGIRTHIIVCCAAALMMIVSKYGFVDLTDSAGKFLNGTRGADPARIAAQIVSGVSFLGAGIIFRNGTSIRGLTTAAGIWATSGIGMAIGSGMFILGIFATIVVALLQIIMHRFALNADSLIIGQVHCRVMNGGNFLESMNNYFHKHNMQILVSKIAINEDGSTTYDLTLRMSMNITMNELSDFFVSSEGVKEVRCELGN